MAHPLGSNRVAHPFGLVKDPCLVDHPVGLEVLLHQWEAWACNRHRTWVCRDRREVSARALFGVGGKKES